MDNGHFIDNYLELIILDEKYNIYISRKAIKHFVESRKKEMVSNHSKDEIINKLYFAVDNILNVYINHSEIKEVCNNRLKYIKYFNEIREYGLCVVFDVLIDRFEICSIHFKKRKISP